MSFNEDAKTVIFRINMILKKKPLMMGLYQ